MNKEFAFDVFLAHSAEDTSVAVEIAKSLHKDGIRVWLNEWMLKPGSIPAKTEEGLDCSRVLVLCLSANAYGSEWAQLASGAVRFIDPLNTERRFLFLRLDASPIMGSLAQFPYIDWSAADREQEYAKLLEACRPPARTRLEGEPAEIKLVPKRSLKLGPKAETRSFQFSPDGSHVLVASDDGLIRLWDMASGKRLKVLRGHEGPVISVQWSAGQRRALSGSKDRTIRLWDVESRNCLRVFTGHRADVNGLAWSSDGRYALSGSNDNTVRVWEVESGRCLHILEGRTWYVNAVSISPDSRYGIHGVSADKTLRVWDLATGRTVRVMNDPGDRGYKLVNAFAWCHDNRRVFSGTSDGKVRLWDVETGKCLQVFDGLIRGALCVALSPDERFILAGSADGMLRVWEVETGQCLPVHGGHSTFVRHVAWSTNQYLAFSADSCGRIRTWDLSEFIAEPRSTANSQ